MLPTIHPSVWAQLVAPDLKVPCKLGQAAAAALAGAEPFAPKSAAAVRALALFIGRAVTGKAVQGGPANSLFKAVAQQLQQSGFLSTLPGLLDGAAAAVAALQQEPGLADVPQSFLDDLDTLAPAAAATASRVLGMQDVSRSLLEICQHAVQLWSQLLDMAVVAVPALRLCTALCTAHAALLPLR